MKKIMKTADGEHAATVQEVIDALTLGIRDGRYQPDDAFVTSSDPEGNRFVAFTVQDVLDASRVGVKAERLGYKIDDLTEDNAVVVMAMFEIDPEF